MHASPSRRAWSPWLCRSVAMLPTSAASAQLFNAMVGSGLGEEDSVAALKLLEGLSGD